MSEANPLNRGTKAEPETEQQVVEKDTNNSPGSEETTDELQDDPSGSPALDDPDIDKDAVTTLPGTGGPDDEGDIDVDPSELNL
jgi:hypothetical protein